MAAYNIVMPKMGESVQEATITRWLKHPGDTVEEDDVLLEIATDKVDSEIPSPVAGVISKVLFEEGAKVPVGEVIAIIDLEGAMPESSTEPIQEKKSGTHAVSEKGETRPEQDVQSPSAFRNSGRFYSPLVQSIARKEHITAAELDKIQGSGRGGRVRKQDVMAFLENRNKADRPSIVTAVSGKKEMPAVSVPLMPGDEVIVMDRMRKLIAEHMVMSKKVSPHVANFVEADVTHLVLWREKVKDDFQKREKQKLTYMPVFIEAAAKALKEFPAVNASVDGDKIILRKDVNIGIAVALPSGNLIVPVLRNADQKSLLGITTEMNRLADDARSGNLKPDDIQGGTFTITNFGTFRNLTGTPIINQPQVAILATGTIEKKPAVLETPTGDVIAIRHKMILSLSYDHRVVDGALGGSFLRRIADILEGFDGNRSV
ncbi:MAG: 2-oxo acid dehydrogenase subunit E2 [Bacteroidales bacterium]|nr:2-oxo acid dehydrogenase subunit E2 [Bacteroidales bacterium]